MSLTLPDCPKFTVGRTGLTVHVPLSFAEWAAMAPRLHEASRCIGFLIGDWLVYGQTQFATPGLKSKSRVSAKEYAAAVEATGLDRTTLATYAYVARRVPHTIRHETLSWEHHKIVAKLEMIEQTRWLKRVGSSSERISTRRLRKSIQAGRLLNAEEIKLDPADRGIPNHIPQVNRLCAWWAGLQRERWLEKASPQQRAQLKRDLLPIMQIYERL
jgi:hypothetical protein